jgi:hypothetical protein
MVTCALSSCSSAFRTPGSASEMRGASASSSGPVFLVACCGCRASRSARPATAADRVRSL